MIYIPEQFEKYGNVFVEYLDTLKFHVSTKIVMGDVINVPKDFESEHGRVFDAIATKKSLISSENIGLNFVIMNIHDSLFSSF